MATSRLPLLGLIAAITAVLLFNVTFWNLPRGRYSSIVIHHTASQSDNVDSIRHAHRARGWFEVAYHLVLSNGSAGNRIGQLESTWRYRLGMWSTATRSLKHNLNSVHLCVVGNYETHAMPAPLQASLGNAVSMLQRRFGIPDSEIYLHRQCNSTACPGQNVTRSQILQWTSDGSETTSQATKSNHQTTLNQARLVPWIYTVAWLVINGVAYLVIRRCRRSASSPRFAPTSSQKTEDA